MSSPEPLGDGFEESNHPIPSILIGHTTLEVASDRYSNETGQGATFHVFCRQISFAQIVRSSVLISTNCSLTEKDVHKGGARENERKVFSGARNHTPALTDGINEFGRPKGVTFRIMQKRKLSY